MPPLDRLERLTDLVLVLSHASRPLTLDEIAQEVPGYPQGAGARRQAFERDKRLLRDEGIPVVTEAVAGPEQYGYRVDPDDLYLPSLGLDPDESAALQLAVAAVELGDPSGRDALSKLGASGVGDARPLAALAPLAAPRPALRRRRASGGGDLPLPCRDPARGRRQHRLPPRALVPGRLGPRPRHRRARSASTASRASPRPATPGPENCPRVSIPPPRPPTSRGPAPRETPRRSSSRWIQWRPHA